MTISLEPNRPLTLSLSDVAGELDGDYYVIYPTSDGRILRVSRALAVRINELDLKPGESFSICKDADGKGPASYRVWLPASTEQERAKSEPPELEQQLAASLQLVNGRRKPAKRAEPEPVQLGTGTNGPAPAAIPATLPAKPLRVTIPYNIAFREVTQFVTRELSTIGEQWNDEAKQGMISTVLIAAAKQGLLSIWERPDAR